ncbi:hypothetical protein CDAR_606071 [Caerostris darwini]|uniref:Uncharacterized protein n=1 Tax=Caerostris darwini TaxID=1538125 RepID=A0AAV4RDW6_9ARAC|nr:hypothetical protein CDAR_606071 [Caerostris darwini]
MKSPTMSPTYTVELLLNYQEVSPFAVDVITGNNVIWSEKYKKAPLPARGVPWVSLMDNLKGNHSPLNRIICVQSHHDSLAQKVESNHSDTHQLRVGSPHTRPLTLIWATSGVCYLVFILTVLKQILKVVD